MIIFVFKLILPLEIFIFRKILPVTFQLDNRNKIMGGSKNHLIESLNAKNAEISQSTRRIFGYPSLREKFLELPKMPHRVY